MKKNNKPINRRKVLVISVLFIFCALFAKLLFVQIIKYAEINKAVERMVKRENIETPKRGDILDARGRVLATSIKKYTVFLDPKIITDFEKVKKVLSKNGIKVKEKRLKDFGDTSYVPIAHNIDADIVREIKSEKLRGIGFESKYSREYPEGRLLAHILGITSSEGNGLEGIEKVCNQYLSGESVKSKQYKDGRGRLINQKLIDQSKMRGLDIELTIDKNIQFIAEQELRKVFSEYKAKRAICIVQNPKNGAILAMVSLPDFDFKDKVSNVKLLRNSAISDVFEPGSTFKIVAVAAAIEENKVKKDELFYLENGRMKIGKHTIRDDHKIKGYASVSKIMEESSNIGMVKIADKMGSSLFYEYIRKFGFYSFTGIDLPGEAKGLLSDEKDWNKLTMPTVSFGQGIGVTALQLINAFSAIANDGILMKPIIIKNIDNTQEEDKHFFEPKEIRRVISPETAGEMKNILKNIVDKGTGKKAKVPGYTTGGKTGTAQKYDPEINQYSKKHYIASFAGMIPAIDPQLVILIIVDEPRGDYYASSVAAPVFSKIAFRTAEYLNIPVDDKDYENSKIEKNKKVKK